MTSGDRGRVPPIPQRGIELGIWNGTYQNMELPWLHWWDLNGNLLFMGEERANQEAQRADRLAAKL